ncbi:PKD domain-containing protein [Tenacibaculum sp. M341]|uniref:PKD domain-containing protein n=2 Tax=Tenacibaculum TaxID=104267 RepID=UPI0014054C33|nr:PKD domain-containing protein [Tenacibaculum sp. M341]
MKNLIHKIQLLCLVLLFSSLNILSQSNKNMSNFVYAEGDKFMLNGKPFYFSGANVYDFFTYGSSSGDIETQFMDKDRIDAHMRKLYENGIRVIRIWGFSHEDWHGFEPQKGVYSEAQFSLFDYVVKSAESNGLKLIIALENYWNDYGGIKDRLKWEGIDVEGAGTHDQGQFFTNASAIQGYKDYVEYFITRKNHYDGVEYRNDPTILAWELMNEPRYQGFGDDLTSDTLRAWVDDMGAFIKNIDSNHLLGTGLEAHGLKYGFGGDEGNDFIKIHESPYVDFTSAHPYIRESWADFTLDETMALICQWADESHDQIKKPLYIGEFNVEKIERLEWWDEIYGFIEEKKIGGSAFWWFPDNNTPRDKFGVFEGDIELAIYKEHAFKMEEMSGGEIIYSSLMSPKSGDKYVSGSSVHIATNLINENNTVSKVEFYANGVKIGEDSIAPFELDIQLADGNYSITSKAIGRNGDSKTSTPRTIQVGGDGILALEYKDASEGTVTNIIKPHFRIKNNASVSVAYEDLSIRYWFDIENDLALSFFTDYAQIGSSNVKGKFVTVDEDTRYLEITFTDGAGVLESNVNSGRIEAKFANSNWSDMNQANDYSYNSLQKEFKTWNRVGLYLNGVLISGEEPTGITNNAPIAVLNASTLSGDAPLEVLFDASASSDTDGDTITYAWDFGNGDTSTEETVTYTFTESGTYEVTLTVSDGILSTTATETITVKSTDVVASFITDTTSGVAPLLVNFDATASTDPSGNGLSYNWDFGDGATDTGVTVAHTFTQVGSYEVVLTVDNGAGLSDTESMTITVREETTASIGLEYKDGGGNATDNMVNPHLRIVNNGNESVNYEDISIRYWFTSEGNNDLNFWCDWAQLGSQFVNGTFGILGGVNYLEVSFDAGAGALAASQNSGPIQGRLAKSNWSPFDETNDYSYNAAANSYQQNNNITLYLNGTLIAGTEPSALATNELSSVTIFPNPATNYINIKGYENTSNLMIRVIDFSGNTINKDSSNKVMVNDLSQGVYTIEIYNPKTNESVRKKLLIKR